MTSLTPELAVQLGVVTEGSVGEGWVMLGTESLGAAKLNALVRSPVIERRQAVRLGTSAPKRVSRKRSSEV